VQRLQPRQHPLEVRPAVPAGALLKEPVDEDAVQCAAADAARVAVRLCQCVLAAQLQGSRKQQDGLLPASALGLHAFQGLQEPQQAHRSTGSPFQQSRMSAAYSGGQPSGMGGRLASYTTAYSTCPTVMPSYSASPLNSSHTAAAQRASNQFRRCCRLKVH
jgi:hypothetical protein